MMNLPIRPRRNRKSANIRGLIRETSLSPEHLIYPVFVHEGTGNQPISSPFLKLAEQGMRLGPR